MESIEDAGEVFGNNTFLKMLRSRVSKLCVFGCSFAKSSQPGDSELILRCLSRDVLLFSSREESCKKKKKLLHSFQYRLGVMTRQSPSPQLAQRHTVQGCFGRDSIVTCVKLTNLGFEFSLARQKVRTSTTRPFGRGKEEMN